MKIKKLIKYSVSVFFVFALLPTANAQKDGWVLHVDNQENYNPVTLANGIIGVIPSVHPFQLESIILNNVYEFDHPGGDSRIIKGINPQQINILIDGEQVTLNNLDDWSQSFDIKRAVLVTEVNFKQSAKITFELRALNQLPYILLGSYEITPLKPIDIEVRNSMQVPVEHNHAQSKFRILYDGQEPLPVQQTTSESTLGSHTIAASASFLMDEALYANLIEGEVGNYRFVGFKHKLKKNTPFRFAMAGAVCTSAEFSNPAAASDRFVIYAMKQGASRLIKQHETAWEKNWESDIIIEGDPGVQQDIRLALYHLYAFSRAGSRLSIAPMGLSSQGYNGHIFWDAEIWMFPPLLLLQPDFAKNMIDYRFDRLDAARRKAANHGFKGAMFPWESDRTGQEATPPWALTGTFEHHITADVAIAFWNYFRVTGDTTWLRQEGFQLLKEVADFWVSRVTENPNGSYSIENVVGADEYAQNIDDNAFTNGSAKIALKAAAKAANIVGEEENPKWLKIAQGITLHHFSDSVIKEHKTYQGETIKQADVNLLTYPLGLISDNSLKKKNLDYYANKIDKNGPAMGLAILAIIHSQLGNPETAYELFRKSYEHNKRPPFGVLSESPNLNNPYFATAAGGMLQTMLFGFGGLEITDQGIVKHDRALPSKWDKLILKGIGMEKKTYIIEKTKKKR
jgi:trehalose/maltose hydrolase-like predicted phosphorylase